MRALYLWGRIIFYHWTYNDTAYRWRDNMVTGKDKQKKHPKPPNPQSSPKGQEKSHQHNAFEKKLLLNTVQFGLDHLGDQVNKQATLNNHSSLPGWAVRGLTGGMIKAGAKLIDLGLAWQQEKNNPTNRTVPEVVRVMTRGASNIAFEAGLSSVLGVANIPLFLLRVGSTQEQRDKVSNTLKKTLDIYDDMLTKQSGGVTKAFLLKEYTHLAQAQALVRTPEILERIKENVAKSNIESIAYAQTVLSKLVEEGKLFVEGLYTKSTIGLDKAIEHCGRHYEYIKEKYSLSKEALSHYFITASDYLEKLTYIDRKQQIAFRKNTLSTSELKAFEKDIQSGFYIADKELCDCIQYALEGGGKLDKGSELSAFTLHFCDRFTEKDRESLDKSILDHLGNPLLTKMYSVLTEEQKKNKMHQEEIFELKVQLAASLEKKTREKQYQACQQSIDTVSSIGHLTAQALNLLGHNTHALKINTTIQAGCQVASAINVLKNTLSSGPMPYLMMASAGLALANMFVPSGPNPTQVVLEAIQEVMQQIGQLRQEMHQRFDDIENQLDRIHHTVLHGFSVVNIKLENIIDRLVLIHEKISNVKNDVHETANTHVSYLKSMLNQQKEAKIAAILLKIDTDVQQFLNREHKSKKDFDKIFAVVFSHASKTACFDLLTGADLADLEPYALSNSLQVFGYRYKGDFFIGLVNELAKRHSKVTGFRSIELLPNPTIYQYVLENINKLLVAYFQANQHEKISDLRIEKLEQLYHQGMRINAFILSLREPSYLHQLFNHYKNSIAQLALALDGFFLTEQQAYSSSLNQKRKLNRRRLLEKQYKLFNQQLTFSTSSSLQVYVPSRWWYADSHHNKNGWGGGYAHGPYSGGAFRSQYVTACQQEMKNQAGLYNNIDSLLESETLPLSYYANDKDAIDVNLKGFMMPQEGQEGPVLPLPKKFTVTQVPIIYCLSEAYGYGYLQMQYKVDVQTNEFTLSLQFMANKTLFGEDKTFTLAERKLTYEGQAYSGHEAIWVYWLGRTKCSKSTNTLPRRHVAGFDPCGDGSSNWVNVYAYYPSLYEYKGKCHELSALAYREGLNQKENEVVDLTTLLQKAMSHQMENTVKTMEQRCVNTLRAKQSDALTQAFLHFDLSAKYLYLTLHFILNDSLYNPHHFLHRFFHNNNYMINGDQLIGMIKATHTQPISTVMAGKCKELCEILPIVQKTVWVELTQPHLHNTYHHLFLAQLKDLITHLKQNAYYFETDEAKLNASLLSSIISETAFFIKNREKVSQDVFRQVMTMKYESLKAITEKNQLAMSLVKQGQHFHLKVTRKEKGENSRPIMRPIPLPDYLGLEFRKTFKLALEASEPLAKKDQDEVPHRMSK